MTEWNRVLPAFPLLSTMGTHMYIGEQEKKNRTLVCLATEMSFLKEAGVYLN